MARGAMGCWPTDPWVSQCARIEAKFVALGQGRFTFTLERWFFSQDYILRNTFGLGQGGASTYYRRAQGCAGVDACASRMASQKLI